MGKVVDTGSKVYKSTASTVVSSVCFVIYWVQPALLSTACVQPWRLLYSASFVLCCVRSNVTLYCTHKVLYCGIATGWWEDCTLLWSGTTECSMLCDFILLFSCNKPSSGLSTLVFVFDVHTCDIWTNLKDTVHCNIWGPSRDIAFAHRKLCASSERRKLQKSSGVWRQVRATSSSAWFNKWTLCQFCVFPEQWYLCESRKLKGKVCLWLQLCVLQC